MFYRFILYSIVVERVRM